MNRLHELAAAIRSSNAGATRFTLDVILKDPVTFARVRDSNVIDQALIARLYSVPAAQARIFHVESALAIKITIPRAVLAGNPDDTDIDGKQQHAPLLDIEIP